MNKQILDNFVEFIRNPHSETDMELVNLGKSLGQDLVPFKKLKDSQDDNLVDEVRRRALSLMEKRKENVLDEKDLFFVGSIDFMITKDNDGEIQHFLLESNGGSSRGISSLTFKQQKLIYEGYMEAINLAIKKNRTRDKKLIIIGVPINDGLIHEKALMISYFRKKLIKRHIKIGVYNISNFHSKFSEDIAFVIANYLELSTRISYEKKWIIFNGHKVDLLIGDGITRRLKDDNFKKSITKNIKNLNTIIVNPIFLITDDKSFSYLAKHLVNPELERYNIAKFLFTKASNEKELTEKINLAINKYDKAFIIKPHGGSGGVGVMSVFPAEIKKNPSRVKEIIKESMDDFYTKFMKTRDPFPYTIQEMAKFSLIDWRKGKHTFDIRIYLSQVNGKIIPVGGLARIARGNFIKGLNKEEFVVNLSGFDGRVEVDRGLGFSEKNLNLLNLDLHHFVDLFCNSSIIFRSIAKNYQKIIDFSKWDKIIGPE